MSTKERAAFIDQTNEKLRSHHAEIGIQIEGDKKDIICHHSSTMDQIMAQSIFSDEKLVGILRKKGFKKMKCTNDQGLTWEKEL